MMTAWMGPSFRGCGWAGEFYAEAVRPLLDQEFPGLRYAAALLGPGSEVLGFDTERSTDHDWGPRLQVFLGADDAERPLPGSRAPPDSAPAWPRRCPPPAGRTGSGTSAGLT